MDAIVLRVGFGFKDARDAEAVGVGPAHDRTVRPDARRRDLWRERVPVRTSKISTRDHSTTAAVGRQGTRADTCQPSSVARVAT